MSLLGQKGNDMEERIKMTYFYGKEADQYSFYRIPKLLFTDEYFKTLSTESKVLYGLMLDRMSLSVKNQWLDEEGRAYIYFSVEEIMDFLGCSNKKAITLINNIYSDVDDEDSKDIRFGYLIAVFICILCNNSSLVSNRHRLKVAVIIFT